MKFNYIILKLFLFLCPLLSAAQEMKINTGVFLVGNGKVSLVVNNAAFKNDGTFIPGASEVKFTGNSDTGISYISGNSITTYNKLKISKPAYGVAVKSPVSVRDSLNITAGNLFTNDILTLKSDSNLTASIGKLPVDGSGNATSLINGNVTIERFFPLGKAWHLLTAPVKSSGSPTINAAWQEGLTTASANSNLYPGYGVHIMGGTTANGFDQSPTNTSSIKTYNNATNSFLNLPAIPGTNTAISSYPGYFLYIRGNRSIDLMQGVNAAITSTTLRVRGQVKTGIQTAPVYAYNYTVVGNPFASTIDFHTTAKNNVPDVFYLWDPKLAGNYGLGGYVTLIWNSGTGSYDATTSVSAVSRYIPAGEAFIVRSADSTNPGTISFTESDKNSASVARPGGLGQRLRVNLYVQNNDATFSLLDGVLTTYADDNMNSINNDDALKITGSCESIGIKRENKMLAIERRKTITANDTCFLNLYQMKLKNYKLEVVTENLNGIGTIAAVKDNFSNNNTVLNMNDSTSILFSVTNDPASYDVGRFSIEFNYMPPLALNYRSVKACRQGKNIAVEWITSNEINIIHYEVERSADGLNFTKVNTTAPLLDNGETSKYRFIDTYPLKGNNFYRINAVAVTAEVNYSNIVKVNFQDPNDIPSFNIYPNPIKGNNISVRFANQQPGAYQLRLINSIGQEVYTETILINNTDGTLSLALKNKLTSGIYSLEIRMPDNITEIKQVIVQ